MTDLWPSIVALLQEQLQDPAVGYLPRLQVCRASDGELELVTTDELAELVVRKNLLARVERLASELSGGECTRVSLTCVDALEDTACPPPVPPATEEPPAPLFMDGDQMMLFDLEPRRAARVERVACAEAALELRPSDRKLDERVESSMVRSGLQRHNDFESFVRGSSNEFAFEAARAVVNAPGTLSNPLVLCGGVGLGKTHLMNAVGLEALRRNPDLRVRFLSSETFVNEMIASIRDNDMDRFRRRNRLDVDLLLVDDIQFIMGKDRSQEEFFHTFNDLHGSGRQIVLTSDRLPQDMPQLEERLVSRLAMGLIADIHPPDLETRIAILSRFAERRGFRVLEDALDFIARTVCSNVRELHGVMNRIGTLARIRSTAVTVAMAEEQLGAMVADQRARITPDVIVQAVCDVFGVRSADLKGRRRTATVALPRKVAMYLCKTRTSASYPELGRYFGGRDHTTVMAACKSIEKLVQSDRQVADQVQAAITRLR